MASGVGGPPESTVLNTSNCSTSDSSISSSIHRIIHSKKQQRYCKTGWHDPPESPGVLPGKLHRDHSICFTADNMEHLGNDQCAVRIVDAQPHAKNLVAEAHDTNSEDCYGKPLAVQRRRASSLRQAAAEIHVGMARSAPFLNPNPYRRLLFCQRSRRQRRRLHRTQIMMML